MGQVRKDILNGWKEIGAYVGRDKRTVERWEKLRGLPIHRVPGAGRATVYALTSELDEWLDDSQQHSRAADPNPPGDEPLRAVATDPPSDRAFAAGPYSAPGFSDADFANFETPIGTVRRKSSHAPTSGQILGRQRWMTGVTIGVAAGLLILLSVPLVRGRANSSVPQTQRPENRTALNSVGPYHSPVPGVEDLYLQGVYFYEQRTPESLDRSLQNLSAAIAKDPNYAPAYAGLANTYNLLREYSVMPDSEAYPKAKAAAQRAIALDPNLAQAHAALGFIEFFWSWDTTKAEREFQTALRLDPSSVLAHHWYGSVLIHEGRYAEAMDQLDIAQRLEPSSAAVLSTRALALGLSGHRSEAMDLLQNVINETPGASSPHAIVAILSRVEPRDPARILDEMRRVGELRHSKEMQQLADAAEPAYRHGGEPAMWKSILATEEKLHNGRTNPNFLMIDAETALGRNNDAFDDLLKLLRNRDPEMIGIVMDPMLSPLHQDRRYGQLVASVGLPPPTR